MILTFLGVFYEPVFDLFTAGEDIFKSGLYDFYRPLVVNSLQFRNQFIQLSLDRSGRTAKKGVETSYYVVFLAEKVP